VYISQAHSNRIKGYHDVGSDILFNLREYLGIQIITPTLSPNPAVQEGWCFPDTEAGILSAIKHGATHIWAHTVLFAAHPLQTGPELAKYESTLIVNAQPPILVEFCDDKEYLNNFLRAQTDVPMPRAWSIDEDQNLENFIHENSLPFPIVAKPVRGRGSQGVKVCRDQRSLFTHLQEIFPESSTVMLEEFLVGEEATIAVMPPSDGHTDYWSLPVVTRFNHIDDVAPYSGVIAVARNSRPLSWKEANLNPTYVQAARDCEKVAKLLKTSSPIRIDIRRFEKNLASPFALFDINMKPVSIFFFVSLQFDFGYEKAAADSHRTFVGQGDLDAKTRRVWLGWRLQHWGGIILICFTICLRRHRVLGI
jgi:hypothetical protein